MDYEPTNKMLSILADHYDTCDEPDCALTAQQLAALPEACRPELRHDIGEDMLYANAVRYDLD